MKANYHTHTIRCQHATGNDEAYVLSALKGGYEELGFSDHTPWNYRSGYVSNIRMQAYELPEYTGSIRVLKEKYKHRIRIKAGLECEYFEAYIPWLKEIIRQEKLDYILFGNHFYSTDERDPYFGLNTVSPEMLELYEESTLKGLEAGLFSCLAHPDLFGRSYPVFDKHCERISRNICRKAARLHIPLEYNLSGFATCKGLASAGYPNPRFWEIAAEEGCLSIIGVDAHSNQELEDTEKYREAGKFLESLGIKRVDTIRFFEHD